MIFRVVLLLIVAVPALAAEMVVQGEVVDVVPITDADPASGACHPPRPGAGAGLTELLAWDLRTTCAGLPAGGRAVSGYRVYYRWDGRTYSRVMAEPPGDTVSLRIRLQ